MMVSMKKGILLFCKLTEDRASKAGRASRLAAPMRYAAFLRAVNLGSTRKAPSSALYLVDTRTGFLTPMASIGYPFAHGLVTP